MAAINRPTKPCLNPHCGNTLFKKDYQYVQRNGERVFEEVFQCTNCTWYQTIKRHPRRTNAMRALAMYQAFKKAWEQVDADLHELCSGDNPNRIPNGCLLVHGSAFNHHLDELLCGSKLTNFQVQYHNREAAKDLEEAKAFVVRTQTRKGLNDSQSTPKSAPFAE